MACVARGCEGIYYAQRRGRSEIELVDLASGAVREIAHNGSGAPTR